MNNIIKLIKKNRLPLLGVVIGGVGGYFYWLYVGCAGGTCPITASPYLTVVWGAITGGLFFSLFASKKEQE